MDDKNVGDKFPIILLLPPSELPIPAVGGGAIETLITNLLDVNEKEKKAKFVVMSKYDKAASLIKYQNSKIFYFDNKVYVGKNTVIIKFLWCLYKVWLKVFQNHIITKLFRNEKPRMDYFAFQCYCLAKREHVNFVVNEGRWDDRCWYTFNDLVGTGRFYNHIHCRRNEDLYSRKLIHNSISISNFVKKEWVINNEIPGCHEVLYNGIDIEKFQLKLSSKERLDERRKLNVSDDEILVIFCGRLIPEKGVKELLDAFELLSNEPIKLLLIGNVAFSGNSVTDFSIEIMKRAEAAPNIIPMGYIPNGQMPVYYAISDIQVVPSIWQEGAGLVAIEGMASGLPLIVTRSGGMVEYVDEKTAIQVPIDEELVDNLAKEIRYLACHEYERKTMGEFGSKRAGQFSKEQYYEDFIEIAKNGTDMCAKLRVIY